MSATQDFVSLDWIKTEISQILEQAQHSLERAVETEESTSEMRACLSAVHQVHGSLKMVQIDGPVSIAREMEELTEALMNDDVPDIPQAQEILMQSILQLPGYLDRIQREQKDNSEFFIPVINNLRVARGEEGIETEGRDGTIDQFVLLINAPTAETIAQFEELGGVTLLRKLRQRYQKSLVSLLKNKQVKENLVLIGKVFSRLIKTCGDSPIGNLSELGIALIEGVVGGAIKLDASVVRHLKLIDAVLKPLIESDSLLTPIPDGLGQDIYQTLKSSSKETPKITLALAKFDAESPQSDLKVESVEFGPDDDTLAAVSSILIEEIVKITDSLDLYVRSSNRNSEDLFALLPLLSQISSTLSVVGLANHQESIVEQISLIESIQASKNDPSEDQLLQIAGALLEIQSDLAKTAGSSGESGAETIGDINEAQAAVIRETRNSLAKCKDALIDYVSNDFIVEKIEVLPEILRNLKGGLFIANQHRSADVLEVCANYVAEVLVKKGGKPSLGEMDDLADAITSIDYYLERFLESASDPYVQMIEVAEEAMRKLDYGVETLGQQESLNDTIITQVSGELIPVQEPSEETLAEEVVNGEITSEESLAEEGVDEEACDKESTADESLDEALEDIGFEETTGAQEVNELEETLEQSQEIEDDDLIDDEIIEIFIEEAEEVLETIQEYLPQWQSNHENEEARTEIRRAFHTLKGSGRMVGATVVGELAWSIEDMLNRVIDNTIPLSEELLSLVAEVAALVPEGVEAFKNNNQDAFKVETLVSRVEAITSGETKDAAEIEPSAETQEPSIEKEEPSAETQEPSDSSSDVESTTIENLEADDEEQITEDAFFEEFEELDLEELSEVSTDLGEKLVDEALSANTGEDDFFEAFEEIDVEEFSSNDDVEEPSANKEPSADKEPSANEELLLELEEPSIQILDEDSSLEVESAAADMGEISEEAFFEVLEEIELEAPSEESDKVESVDFSLDAVGSSEPIEEPELEAEPNADAELDAIFKEEANENIEILRSYLASGGQVPPEVVAAYHTLKGSAGMAGVPVISRIAAPLETHSNQLFVAGVADDTFPKLVARSIELMELVLADLSVRRDVLDELDEFLAQIDEMESQLEEIELPPLFEFDKIDALSRQEGNADNWNEARVEKIVEELKWVQEQAIVTSQNYLGEITSAMLSVYMQLDSKPPLAVTELLNRAHENLIIIFDHIASSQNVVVDDELIDQLRSIDVEELSMKEELSQFAKDGFGTLEHTANLLAEWANEPNNLLPMEQICAGLSQLEEEAESRRISVLANQIEVILQFCEKLSKGALLANNEDVALLESGFAELQRQLACLDKGDTPDSDDLILSSFRNRLETTAITGTDNDGTLLPADEIEEDILPIFIEEAEELCEAIDESILAWSGDTTSTTHLNNLLRHLHTIKGGARLAGLNSLGEYTHNFETFLIGVQQNPTGLNDQFFALLNSHQDEITRRVGIYNKILLDTVSQADLDSLRNASAETASPAPTQLDSIETSVGAFDEEAVEESAQEKEEAQSINLPVDDIDDDILAIFIEEAEELIESLDQSILDWSNNTDTDKHFDNLLRYLHTMKGGARLAGLNSLGEYTHNFETYLIGVQQNPVAFDDDFFAGLNKHQDEITRRVEIYKKRVQGEASEDELQSLSKAAVIPDATGGSAARETVVQETRATEPAATVPSNQPQEMVRVSADLLEDLISLSGEANITRGRIEQQIRDFGESLQEMEDTIDRIREQVRRLEIEAESRETVLRNHSGAGEGDSNFDELEMDRYTMLQEISRTLNESSSDMAGLKDTLVNKSRDAETLLHQQARIGSELQEGLTRTRMVPISRLIPRLRRIVRQISAEVGKSVRFDAFNVEGELDRNVLERIVAPLEHMLRNAVDHGIESAEKRKEANKPETGRISMRLSREGGYVLLTISDDGGGINVEAVKSKAIERGIITKDSDVSDQDVMQFVMHAGFSTAAKLTQISGRGVGMDVVNSEIKQLGGSVTIDSTMHVGTEFTIRIPFTVSINRALMVVVKDETFAVPLNTIEGIVRVSPYELEAYYQPDAPMFEYAGQPYRLNYMGEMLNKKGGPILEGQVALMPVILARSGDDSVALQVDRVIGSREVVVKSLGPQFNEVGGVSGATVLGDGRVVIILDVMALVQNHETRQKEQEDKPEIVEIEPVYQARKIMIVDDSVTVRKVTTRLMERQGWEVTTAKDGVDAINQLQDYYPDIMLLDIEMPKMDGFGVLRAVRRDPRLGSLPIIMITSRTGEKHKQQAFELGVNQYLGKPFQEANLLNTIESVIEETKS